MPITHYVVQSFVRGEDGELIAEGPIEARSEHGALSLMRRLAVTKAGVLAFSRAGDPALGDFGGWGDPGTGRRGTG